MVHDPDVEVTCDTEDCDEAIFLTMKWYVGGYDLKASDLHRLLEDDHKWSVVGDKHFCEECTGS